MIYMRGPRCKTIRRGMNSDSINICTSSPETSATASEVRPEGNGHLFHFSSPGTEVRRHVLGDSEDNRFNEDRGEERPYDRVCLS